MYGVLRSFELHVHIAVLDLIGGNVRRDAAEIGHALLVRRKVFKLGKALSAAGRFPPDDRYTRLLHDAGKHLGGAGRVLVDKNDHRHIEI